MQWLYSRRYTVNIIFLLIGVGVVIFYTLCGDACTYLQGGLFGIELQYLGMAYVAVLILCNILKQNAIILVLLSAGVGAEIFLVGYQVAHSTYCPYCIVFAGIIVVQFLFNMDMLKKLLILACVALGFFCFFLFFEGSAIPLYSGAVHQTISVAWTVSAPSPLPS